jgi:hypothetical protein
MRPVPIPELPEEPDTDEDTPPGPPEAPYGPANEKAPPRGEGRWIGWGRAL